MMERKSLLLWAAVAGFALVSVPSVVFNNAINRYFNFVGHWGVGAVRLNRFGALPPTRARAERLSEPPQPELRFVKFSVKIAGAKEVKIAGDFNKWNPDALPLSRKGKNQWEAVIPLPLGTYKYLCRVDGQDMLDPLNPDTAMEGGRKVSSLTVK